MAMLKKLNYCNYNLYVNWDNYIHRNFHVIPCIPFDPFVQTASPVYITRIPKFVRSDDIKKLINDKYGLSHTFSGKLIYQSLIK